MLIFSNSLCIIALHFLRHLFGHFSRSVHSTNSKQIGFGVNQRIAMQSLGHGNAGTEKFNTLMNIPKPMTVNNYNITVSKIIDVVNFVGCLSKVLR